MNCPKGYKVKDGKCSRIKNRTINMVTAPVGGSGVGFLGILTLIFITLKLLGKITWSWWWVLAPIWIPFVIGIIFMIIFFLIWRKA